MKFVTALLAVIFVAGCNAQTAKHALSQKSQLKPECENGYIREGSWMWNPDHSVGNGWGRGNDGTVEKCTGGKWVIDEAATKKRKEEIAVETAKEKAIADHHIALWNALRTRIVTDAEMKEILELGTEIVPGGSSIDWCGGSSSCGLPQDYREVEQNYRRDAEIILNNALLNQFKMRTFAKDRDEK